MDDPDVGNVVPLHVVGRAHKAGGRPRKVVKRPRRNRSQQAYEAQIRAALDRSVEADPVVLASTQRSRASIAVLEAACIATAREAAGLRFEILRMKLGSRAWERTTSRRIAALRHLAWLILQVGQARPGAPAPATVRTIVELLVTELEQAAVEVLPPDAAGRLRDVLRRKLADGRLDGVIEGR